MDESSVMTSVLRGTLLRRKFAAAFILIFSWIDLLIYLKISPMLLVVFPKQCCVTSGLVSNIFESFGKFDSPN